MVFLKFLNFFQKQMQKGTRWGTFALYYSLDRCLSEIIYILSYKPFQKYLKRLKCTERVVVLVKGISLILLGKILGTLNVKCRIYYNTSLRKCKDRLSLMVSMLKL